MSKIETGRFSERLRRSLGMVGQTMVAGELSPEVSPVIVLQGNDPDQQFLQGVRLCFSSMEQPAVAAQNTLFRILNPQGSGVLASFSHVSFSHHNSVATVFNMGYGTTVASLPTAGATAIRDQRWLAGTNPTSLIASRSNGVGIALLQGLWTVSSNVHDPMKYEVPFILLPGEILEFGGGVNIIVRFNAAWTERPLPALEL